MGGSWWVDSSCSCEEYGYDNKYCCTEKLTFAERTATCNVTFDHWVDTQLARADACLTDGKQMWPDCGDSGIFGSLYVYQLQNFLQYYQPSQMSVIPFNLYTAHADSATVAGHTTPCCRLRRISLRRFSPRTTNSCTTI